MLSYRVKQRGNAEHLVPAPRHGGVTLKDSPPLVTYRRGDPATTLHFCPEPLAVPHTPNGRRKGANVRAISACVIGVVCLALSGPAAAPPAPSEQPRAAQDAPKVTAPPAAFFDRFRENDRKAARAFYKKFVDCKGLS